MPTHSRFARAVMCALLLLLLLGASVSRAVPMGRIDLFDKGPLDERVWRLEGRGDPAAIKVQNGQLVLSPGAEKDVAVVRRFYPLRSEGEKPDFGDFRASIRLASPPNGEMSFALMTPDKKWALGLFLRGQSSQLSLQTWSRPLPRPYEVKPLSFTPEFVPEELLWVRQGRVLEAQLRVPGKVQVLGRYEGDIPPVLDFFLSAAPNSRLEIDELRIEPLPRDRAYSQVLPRPGTPLHSGAHKLGGFLWAPADKPFLRIKIGSVHKEPSNLVLQCHVTDTRGKVLWKREVPVSLAAREEKIVAVAVPAARYGSFLFVRRLVDGKGAPLEAAQATRYGISRAPLPEAISDSSFGIHQSAFARVGAKWQRYWALGGPFWNNTEPSPGKWTWAHSDSFVGRTLAAKMKPLYVLCGPPAWASLKPERGTYLGMGALSPVKDLKAWGNYVRQVARRYKGRVTHYELWNEPNSNGLDAEGFFFYGNVEQYFEMLQVTHAALREADPGAKLLAPSGTGHFFPWLEKLVQMGGLKYFDILSIHTYTQPFPPEIGYQFNGEKSYAHRVARSREIMKAGGSMKPIWNTEIGFQWRATRNGRSLSRDDIAAEALPDSWPNWSRGWSFRPTDTRAISAFVPRFFMESLALGVEKTFLHATLMQDDDASPLEEAPAFGAASWLLSRARFDRRFPASDSSRVMGFTRSDGTYVLAFWRVEDESLTMDREREKSVSGVGSAPLAGTNQNAIASALPPPRATYFPGGRTAASKIKIPIALRGARPRVFDVWGQEQKFASEMAVEEAPRYVVFARKPLDLRPQVLGEVLGASVEPMPEASKYLEGAGVLVASTSSVVREAKNLEELLGSAQRLSLSEATAIESASTQPSKVVNEGEAQLGGIRWIVPEGAPARARLALSVRAGDKSDGAFNYKYEVKVGGQTLALEPWGAWPVQLQFEGEGYAMVQGVALSPWLDLKPGQVLEVRSGRDHGRVFGAWLVAR